MSSNSNVSPPYRMEDKWYVIKSLYLTHHVKLGCPFYVRAALFVIAGRDALRAQVNAC